MKTLLMVYLTLSLPALVGCQMLKNRKPQSAGSAAYCSNCLVEQVDRDVEELRNTMQKAGMHFVKNESVKTPVEVRSVVVFDDNGKPVCRVNLLKHPELVPNFAKPVTSKMVHQANQFKRDLASADDEFESLPPCSDKYLSELKRVAKNNVVVNGDKSYMHKTSTRLVGEIIAACIISGGAGVSMAKGFQDGTVKKSVADTTVTISGGVAMVSIPTAGLSSGIVDDLEQIKKIPDNEMIKIKKIVTRLKGLERVGWIGAFASVCYLVGSGIGLTVYR